MSFDGLDRHPPARPVAQVYGPSTVDFLSGDWTVIRQISDHRTGQVGSFHGMASFQPSAETAPAEARLGPTLAYTESGELRIGGHRGPARRSLLVLDAGDGAADIRFADGREFYRLDLRTGSCAAAHPCRADQYHVTVTRLSADSYAETWRVTGPSKDYELHTTYTRAGHSSAGDTSAGDTSAGHSSAGHSSAGHSSASHSSASHSSAGHSSASHSSAGHNSAGRSSAGHSSARHVAASSAAGAGGRE